MTKIDESLEFDQYLDAKGLNCPLPILKTKVLLNKMAPKQVLLVEATDPHAKIDFEAYCARTEHEIIKLECADDIFKIYIKRAIQPQEI